MAETPDHDECGVERRAAGGIEHDIETLAAGEPRRDIRRRLRLVHEPGAQSLDRIAGGGRARGAGFGATGVSDLKRHLTHTAGAATHHHVVRGADAGRDRPALPRR